MKRALKTATLLTNASLAALLCAVAAPRATAQAAPCPAVAVSCLDSMSRPGEPITFSAGLTPPPGAGAPAFEWEVSAGTIISGQGTRSITVDTTGLGNQLLTATVSVRGLAAGCLPSAACSTMVVRPPEPHPVDTYGEIPFADEKARLDNLAVELLELPQEQGFIVCYGGRRGRRGEARTRCQRAKNYLVRARGLDPARLTLIDGGFRERAANVLWILPPHLPPPSHPTVEASEVEFVGAPKRKRRAPRRH